MTRPRAGAIVAGGGTAGHTLPALCIAEALVDRGWERAAIHFIGSERGQEAALVPSAGFSITLLPGRGIARRLTWQNVGAATGLVRAAFAALGVVRRRRPAVCVSVGGYASVAGALACIVWRVPLVVAEQNARASAANRLVGRFARTCAVAFEGTDLPRAVLCGNPVRAEVIERREHPGSEETRAALGIGPGQRLVVVFAGSLGARRINDAVASLLELWADRNDLVVHHVLGPRDYDARAASGLLEAVGSAATSSAGIVYVPIRYESDLPRKIAAADVVVCRAGGSTVAELAVIGAASVLVPLPGAPRDHQRANAMSLVDAGAAVLVPDGELDGRRLADEIEAILEGDTSRSMAEAARAIGRPAAAARIAELVEQAARRAGDGGLA